MPLKLGPFIIDATDGGATVRLKAARTADEEREANARTEEKARRIFGLN